MIGTTLQDGSRVTSFGWTGHNHERTRRLPDGSTVDEVSDDKVTWLPWGTDGFTERGRDKRDAMGAAAHGNVKQVIGSPTRALHWVYLAIVALAASTLTLLADLGLHYWHWM